jgi:uncharacterized protein YqhQ
MADHGVARYDGPETIEELTEDRERTWAGFTTAVVVVVVAVVALLIGMAVFLL